MISRRIRATRRLSQIAGGSTTSEISDEPPRQRDHRDGGGDGGGEVGGDRGRGRGDDRLHAADVVGDARLHLAGAGPGEEGDRLALQVGEDVGAQPVHDLLADRGADPGLHDARAPR